MARMNDDDSEFKDDPNLDPSKLPGVKQSSYSGPVPTTDYSAMGGNNASTTASTASTGFGGGFGSTTPSTGFGSTTPAGSSTGFGGASAPSFGGSVANNAPAQQQNLTAAGSNAAQGAEVLVAHSKESEDWINKKWRPVMGWVYMLTCTADFVIFPVLWSLLQAMSKGQVTNQWQPLTLQGAGLYHIAMGAVLGIAAYGRTKEKLESKQ
jgi:hypothetical protein